MGTRINPYLALPLPINVKIHFDFFPKPETKIEECIDRKEAVREVDRALNAYAYTKEPS